MRLAESGQVQSLRSIKYRASDVAANVRGMTPRAVYIPLLLAASIGCGRADTQELDPPPDLTVELAPIDHRAERVPAVPIRVEAPPQLVWEGDSQVYVIGFSANGRVFAFLTEFDRLNGTLHLLDLETSERVIVDRDVIAAVGTDDVSLSADGRTVAYRIAPTDDIGVDWTYQSPLRTWTWGDPTPVEVVERGQRSSFRVTPDGGHIIFAMQDRSLQLWDVASQVASPVVRPAYASVYGDPKSAFAMSDDHRYFSYITGFRSGQLRVRDLVTGADHMIASDVWAGTARWAPGTHELRYREKVDYETGRWRSHDLATGDEISGGTSHGRTGFGGHSVLSPGLDAVAYGRELDTASRTVDVYVWSFATGEEHLVASGVRSFQVRWSPGGDGLAVLTNYTDDAGDLVVWRRADEVAETYARQVGTHSSSLSDGVVFSADGTKIAYTRGACDTGHELHVVDLRSGRDVAVSADHACAAPLFTPDSTQVLFIEPGFTGSGALMAYDLTSGIKRAVGVDTFSTLRTTPTSGVLIAVDREVGAIDAIELDGGVQHSLLSSSGRVHAGPGTDTHLSATVVTRDRTSLYLLDLP